MSNGHTNPTDLLHAVSNPFASKFIRAGAIQFVFPKGESLDTFRHRLESQHWWGQIVGPHGSGKTTLLRQLDAAWQQWDRDPIVITLRGGQNRLPKSIWQQTASRSQPNVQIVIDGFEQLSWMSRQRVYLHCRFRGHGLLVTTHRKFRLPLLHNTSTSPELAEAIARQLLNKGGKKHSLQEDDVRQCYESAAGNLRETFFMLYDRVQRR